MTRKTQKITVILEANEHIYSSKICDITHSVTNDSVNFEKGMVQSPTDIDKNRSVY